MRLASLAIACLALAALATPHLTGEAGKPAGDDDETALRKAGIAVDDDGLRAYLRRQGGADDDLFGIDRLLAELGSSEYRVRVRAADKLIAVGPAALAALRKEAKVSADAEVIRSSKRCVDRVVRGWDFEQQRAAVRLMARRAAKGTTAAFVRYLPFVTDEEQEADVWYALDAAARKKPDSLYLEALKDRSPARRAVAAFVLCRYGDEGQRGAARKSLSDPDATVRLRAAQGLLGAKDKSAVPALVALLDQPSVALAWQAEELLHYTAGKASPKELVGAGAAPSRAECRKAWEAWWKANGAKVDLKARAGLPQMPGLVLMFECISREKSQIGLFGCGGPPRWTLELKPGVRDVNLLPGDRMLVAQQVKREGRRTRKKETGEGVTDRDLTGNILWQFKELIHPSVCRRLPNGNTLLIDESDLTIKNTKGDWKQVTEGVIETTPEGKRVFQRHLIGYYDSPWKLAHPYILANGRLLYRQEGGGLNEYDLVSGEKFREVWHQEKVSRGAGIDPLGNGRYLISLDGEVREVDVKGKTVWRYRCENIREARRLKNGNTLISCGGRVDHVIEVTPDKKGVWRAVTMIGPYMHLCLPLVKLGFDGPE